ncbi:MAG: heme exporter protein C [Candidatus Argoarchaeum ethanivorans]|uniref:Heme exporter protein C n=1 Tax=Candidatus Argoarchaeum ethanivorans TaxID=2608793 RepID=A0A8B3S145_9EURY|nr:MAG: heme exporter protein C [Candidatus Argoarchaeum ethanivorans]
MTVSLKNFLMFLSLVLVLYASIMVFTIAPVPVNPGERGEFMTDQQWHDYQSSFKIFYFHLPIAMTAYIAFVIMFLSSVVYLRIYGRTIPDLHKQFKAQLWDFRAYSAAEVGVLFAALTLISGSIWARSAWGVYWLWDVRLTTSLILFLVYLSYLVLRQAIEEPEKRARLSAVFGVVGFMGVPLSFLSIRLWRAHHPLVIGGGGIHGTDVIFPLLLNIAAYVTLAVTLILVRIDNEKLKDRTLHNFVVQENSR